VFKVLSDKIQKQITQKRVAATAAMAAAPAARYAAAAESGATEAAGAAGASMVVTTLHETVLTLKSTFAVVVPAA